VLPGRVLPALTLMALLGSLGFAGWIMTAGRRPGGAVARSGLVTFLMLFGLAASPAPFDISVLDRIGDIGVLSLYSVYSPSIRCTLPLYGGSDRAAPAADGPTMAGRRGGRLGA